jgi:hypothetical protein
VSKKTAHMASASVASLGPAEGMPPPPPQDTFMTEPKVAPEDLTEEDLGDLEALVSGVTATSQGTLLLKKRKGAPPPCPCCRVCWHWHVRSLVIMRLAFGVWKGLLVLLLGTRAAPAGVAS